MVQITIKNFKQESFQINIDEACTVADLKAELFRVNSTMPAEKQTLIYAGVVMEDDAPLKRYQIDENKFIVVMMRKPINIPSKSELPSRKVEQVKNSVEKEAAVEKQKPPNGEPDRRGELGSPNSMSDPIEVERAIQNIVEMGYARQDVLRAFRASYNNPDRAVEYLVNGIPNDCLLGEPAPDMTAVVSQVERSGHDNSPLSFLRANPRFQQMKRILRTNPQMLNTLISQIGHTNPGLLQLITANQEEFVELLNEGDLTNLHNVSSEDEEDDADRPTRETQSVTLSVTQQERDAINRLKALGFAEDLVVQAYFACDKDEEKAANFLLSQND